MRIDAFGSLGRPLRMHAIGKLAPALAALAVALVTGAARAQSPGDSVRVVTDYSTVEGVLVDRTPDGYLVRRGDQSQTVPYADVRSITRLAGGAPAAGPVVPPAAAPTAGAPPEYGALGWAPQSTTWYSAGSVAPSTRRRSPALATGGSVLVALGIVGIVGGAVLLPLGVLEKSQHQCHDPSGSIEFDCQYGATGGAMVSGGIVSLVLGGVFLAAGIPMLAIGSRKVPVGQQPATGLSIGPRGADLRFTF